MGVEKEVLRAGDGPKPTPGQTVTVHCTGFGKNGDLSQKFWSTKDPGQQPFSFQIGQGKVIKGWDEGVLGMQLGEVARLRIQYHIFSDYLLIWMVPAKDLQSFQQHFLWNSPCSTNTTYHVKPGPSAFGYLGLKADQLDGVQGHFQPLLPHFESLAPTSAPYSEPYCAFSHRHGVQAASKDVQTSAQRRFLIFDQSGNDIRLFSSAFHFPRPNQVIMPAGPQSLKDKKLEAGQPSLMKLIAQTTPDENDTSSEGGEIREDTEEINALLSFCTEDDAGDDGDVDGENDELTSTGHSPFATTGGFVEDEKVWELTEEVASTDGSTKRQKLLDGGYKESSLVDTASSPKLFRSGNYDDNVESSCAKGKEMDEDMDPILSIRQSQAKIWEKLRILESILPGMKRKDPVLIIDEAISYLKSLRQKAKALEVS